MVMVELALATVLLTGGVLLTRSLVGLLRVDVGMDTAHVALIGVDVPRRYDANAALIALQQRVVERVRALPGVEAVGTTSTRPLQGGNTNWIRVDGRPYHGEHNEVNSREDLTPVISRRFARGSPASAASRGISAMTPDSAARRSSSTRHSSAPISSNEDPIGRKLLYAPTSTTPHRYEIVGVVDDIKENPLDAVTPPTMYTAFRAGSRQRILALRPDRASGGRGAARHSPPRCRCGLDPDLATFGGNRLARLIDGSVPAYIRRSGAWLVGSFAVCAWLLGVIGLYGVVAYSVGRRTREIGVRMALGAQRGAVARLIIGDAGRVQVIGLVGLLLGTTPPRRGPRRSRADCCSSVTAWRSDNAGPVSPLPSAPSALDRKLRPGAAGGGAESGRSNPRRE